MTGRPRRNPALSLPDAGATHAGMVLLRQAATEGPGRVRCGKRFDHPDPDEPVTGLLLIATDDGGWSAHWRCARHPAADDVSIVRAMRPLSAVLILEVGASQPDDQQPGEVVSNQGFSGACGHCGGRDFVLQLGGQHNGAITCTSCKTELGRDPAPLCSGCGAELELAPVLNHRPGCTAQP